MNITILVFWVYYNWNPFSGIDDNDTMKVFGKGGADIERNKPGDLYVTIKVPFQFFFSVYANSCPEFSQYYARSQESKR